MSSQSTLTSPADTVLTPALTTLLQDLHRRFDARRQALLKARGAPPQGFRADTAAIRDDPDWRVAPVPEALQDRRVEITGPVERKMMINALNSGAKVFMADFEDSHSPTWEGTVAGHVNVQDAVRGRLRLETPAKTYAVGPDPARLLLRVRGLHLDERHVMVDGDPVAAGMFDAATLLLHNGEAMAARGTGPFLYLPKIEAMEEASWWNDVLAAIEEAVGLPTGTTKVTVLIETLPAAFQMEEILYALRDRIVGLNAGRWDYIFSCIKTFRDDPSRILPDRAQVTMTAPFMRAYTELLVATCHRRGAFAMGGMSAFIPDRRDPERNERAFAAVRADKQREAEDGFDGTWVAHPDLVAVAQEPFDAVLAGQPNQLTRQRDVTVTPEMLLDFQVPGGRITLNGLHTNIDVGIRYLAAWLDGRGAVAIHGLMEDAATAEISRSQVWQWLRHAVTTAEGKTVTPALVRGLIDATVDALHDDPGVPHKTLTTAARLFTELVLADDFPTFLTLPAMAHLEEPQ